jgi:hypothetical protein
VRGYLTECSTRPSRSTLPENVRGRFHTVKMSMTEHPYPGGQKGQPGGLAFSLACPIFHLHHKGLTDDFVASSASAAVIRAQVT